MPDFIPAPVPDFPIASEEQCAACDGCSDLSSSYDVNIMKTIDLDETPMRGSVKPFSVHFCIATERSDWPHTIEDEEGSLAQAFGNAAGAITEQLRTIDRIVLSNTSLPVPVRTQLTSGHDVYILSDAWVKLSNVHAKDASQVLQTYALRQTTAQASYQISSLPFKAVVLVCSHMRRDARCGKTAPILLDTLEEVLRERDLFYDTDEGSGAHKVLLTSCSHIGGHRYAGNVLVYRRNELGKTEAVWLGRIMPKDIPWVVDLTIMHGRVKQAAVRGGVQW